MGGAEEIPNYRLLQLSDWSLLSRMSKNLKIPSAAGLVRRLKAAAP